TTPDSTGHARARLSLSDADTIAGVKTIRRAPGLSLLCSLACLIGCGGSGAGPGGGRGGATGTGNMRATIDGQQWVADANSVQVTVDARTPGAIGIVGSHVASASNDLSLQLALGFVDRPHTYPLRVNPGTTPRRS